MRNFGIIRHSTSRDSGGATSGARSGTAQTARAESRSAIPFSSPGISARIYTDNRHDCKTIRPAADGEIRQPAGSHGEEAQYNSLAENLPQFLPAGDVSLSDPANSERLTTALPFFRPVPGLERGNVPQALLDVVGALLLFLFILSVALSIPLALFALLFASF